MTVCIAAICRAPNVPGQPVPTQPVYMIIGASDRMLTTGDIEYEPPRWKAWSFAPQTVALISGDAAVQLELWQRTNAEFMGHAPSVRHVADAYARHFAALRREHVERAVLTPLGLDTSEFLRRQRELSPDLVERIASKLWGSRLNAETIICGIDTVGVNIYVITDPGDVSVYTWVGFAAVGMGQNHAESLFMVSRYTIDWPFERALLLSYTAKKRAETAPGVGAETDMFIIGPLGGIVTATTDPITSGLHKTYEETQVKITTAQEEGQKKVEGFIQGLFKAELQRLQPQQPQPQQSTQQPAQESLTGTRDKSSSVNGGDGKTSITPHG